MTLCCTRTYYVRLNLLLSYHALHVQHTYRVDSVHSRDFVRTSEHFSIEMLHFFALQQVHARTVFQIWETKKKTKEPQLIPGNMYKGTEMN